MSDEEKFRCHHHRCRTGRQCLRTCAGARRKECIKENGRQPYSKNVTGGRLYTYALELVEPGLYKEAALERSSQRTDNDAVWTKHRAHHRLL